MSWNMRLLSIGLVWLTCTPALFSQTRVDALGDPLPPGALARLGTTRMRHSHTADHYCWGVECLAWSPDGKMIATTSATDMIGVEARLWDAATGKPLVPLENNRNHGPRFIRFAPDGKALAATGGPKIVVWDPASGKELAPFVGHKADVDAFVFRDEGKTMVSVGRDGVVLWWDVAGRRVLRERRLLADEPKTHKGQPVVKAGVQQTCFSADGRYVALDKWWKTPTDDDHYGEHMAIVLDLDARKELWRQDQDRYPCRFAIAPDNQRLALSSAAAFIMHDLATGRRLTNAQWHDAWAMCFSPDGKTLALHNSGSVALWTDDKTPARKIEIAGSSHAKAPAFAPDGKKIAVDCGMSFQVLDVAKEKPALAFPSNDDRGFYRLRFSADGRNLFVDKHAFDTASWRERAYECPSARIPDRYTVSRDRTLCVAADGKHPDTVFDTGSGRVVARLAAPKVEPGLHRGFFGPRNSVYVMQDRSCAGKEVNTVFALPSGKRLFQLSFNEHEATHGWSFSADDAKVAYLEMETETIHVREIATGKLLREFGSAGFLDSHALSPSGNLLALWDGKRSVQVFEVSSGNLHRTLALEQKPRRRDGACLLWSADDRLLAVGGLENSAHIWEVASAHVRREFRGHEAKVTGLAFSPDHRILVSGSEDTTLLIWQTAPDRKHRARLGADQLARLWDNLAQDAAAAHEAMADLQHATDDALPFLAERLRPVPTADAKLAARWIKDLDSDDFAARKLATEQIERLGESARGSLLRALTAGPSEETRRRLQQLLAKLTRLTPAHLREARAIELLETIGTPQAQRILETLTRGDADSFATRESSMALARMKNRSRSE